MAFVPRSYEQILVDMVNHVRANTTLTDFNVGSVIRTILEAAALEDDEQYYQMVQLTNAFRTATAEGTDLDERAADLNTVRLPAAQAFGSIHILNNGLTTSELTFNVNSGATSFTIDDSSDFPTGSPPFTVRIGEGTPQVEEVSCNNNQTATNVLTLASALGNEHTAGERVSVVSGSSISIPKGLQVQVPATTNNLPIKFTTVESGSIVAGNYQSSLISIKAIDTGSDGNVPSGQVSQFVGSPPFTGAGVTNPTETTGGRDEEADTDLRDRLLNRYDGLSRGTPNAIENAVIGLEDTNTGKRIATAKLREDFDNLQHTLFIDDGTGLIPDVTQMAATELSSPATGGSTTNLSVVNVTDFPSTGYVLIAPGTVDVELAEYSAKGPGNIIVLDAPVTNNQSAGVQVIYVEVVTAGAEDGQNYFQIDNWPMKLNSYDIYDDRTGTFEKRVDSTDYFINSTNGNLQFPGAGLPEGTIVCCHYSYYTGLLQLAQRTLNGDPDDRTNYPGVVAGGVIIYLDTPTVRPISVTVALQTDVGYDEDEVAIEVRRAIESYIDGRKIGGNIILARIIEKVMSVDGVINVSIRDPENDIVILEDELPVSYDSNGVSLVTVL